MDLDMIRSSAIDEVSEALKNLGAAPAVQPQSTDYLTRGDLMQAVGIAISILKGSKYDCDQYAARSMLALQYGFETAQPKPNPKLSRPEQIEYEKNEHLVRQAMLRADADRLLSTTPPNVLNLLIQAARRQGHDNGFKAGRVSQASARRGF